MKIAFSCALAFVLSMFCFPNLSPLFGDSSSQSTITAEGYSEDYDYVSIVNPSNGTIDPVGVTKFLRKLMGNSSLNIFNYVDFFESWTPTSMTGTGLGTTLNSAEICGNNNGKDILLDDGFMLWTPVFVLATENPGYIEVTLMQAYCGQYSPLADTGYLTGLDFYDGYAPFYDISYNTAPMAVKYAEYPADMYGTSFMRSVVLGNGSNYFMPMTPDYLLGDGSDTLGYEYYGISIYGEYLDYMSQVCDGILPFIAPIASPLQANPKLAGESSIFNFTLNDVLNGTSPNSSCTNYTQKKGYDYWKYDHLFLPGMFDQFEWNITGNQSLYGSDYYLRSTLGKGEAAYIANGQTNTIAHLPSSVPVYPYTYSQTAVRPVANLDLAILCMVATDNVAFTASSGITKKSSTEYHILNFEGLQNLSNYIEAGYDFSGATIYLDNNIDFKYRTFTPIQNFNATFDGQGHFFFNFNANHFIDTMDSGTIQNLNILGWDYSPTAGTTVSFVRQANCGTTFSRINIECNIVGDAAQMAGLICSIVSKSSTAAVNISECSIQGILRNPNFPATSFKDSMFHIGGFVENTGNNSVSVKNSYFIGTIVYGNFGSSLFAMQMCKTLLFSNGSGANASKVTLQGLYAVASTSNTAVEKKYSGTFTDSLWACSTTLNDGYPTLKWNLWAGQGFASTSVTDRLKALSFTTFT